MHVGLLTVNVYTGKTGAQFIRYKQISKVASFFFANRAVIKELFVCPRGKVGSTSQMKIRDLSAPYFGDLYLCVQTVVLVNNDNIYQQSTLNRKYVSF